LIGKLVVNLISKDSMGMFLSSATLKVAEIEFPSINIPVYQDVDTNKDLIEYAEPWGGAQNKPYRNPLKPQNLEQDPSINIQGERPETFVDTHIPEGLPVDNTLVFGEQFIRTRDPGAGDGVSPGADYTHTTPQGDGAYPFNNEVNPIVTSFPYEELGSGEEQTFSDRAYMYASEAPSMNGDTNMNVSSESVKRVVSASLVNGSAWQDNPYKIKVASLEDLYAFERPTEGTLIHKASRELWTISTTPGGVFIEKCFNEDGQPVGI
jgi:hypothetical protein